MQLALDFGIRKLALDFGIRKLALNFEEILAHWVELKKAEGISLVSVRRDKNTLDLFDGDGSDYFYEFEDWLQQQVSAAIKDDCDATDWHALAESICLAVTGSYVPRVQCQSRSELVTD